MNAMLKAAILGTGWGLVHVGPLRRLGIFVDTIFDTNIDRARAVCDEHDIPNAINSLEQLGTPDIIVLATPANTHVEILKNLPSESFIVCEKPLVGWLGDVKEARKLKDSIWVNYAFPFVDTWHRLSQQLWIDEIKSVTLDSSVNLPLSFGTEEWFLETTSHVLAGLIDTLGQPTVIERAIENNSIRLKLKLGTVPVSINFQVGGEAGIFHNLTISEKETFTFPASYAPGRTWRYGPVLADSTEILPIEEHSEDAWLDANEQSLAAMIEIARGNLTREEALEIGCFDVEKALLVERTLF